MYRVTQVPQLPRWAPFWCLCFLAVVALFTSFALSAASASSQIRFPFALLALLTTSVVQRLTLLDTVIILSRRKWVNWAMTLEALLR